MHTFSQHLFRSVIPGILFILLTVGVLLDVLIAERLEEEFDQLLVSKSQGLLALSEFEEAGFTIEQYEHALPQFAADQNGEYFQFLNDEGVAVLSSLSMPSMQNLVSLSTRPSRSYLDIELPDGRQGRVLRTRFLPRVDIDDGVGPGEDLELDSVMLGRLGTPTSDTVTQVILSDVTLIRSPLTLNLAISREPLDSLIMQVHLLLVMTGLFTMAMITWLTRRQIRKTVKPLEAITQQVRSLKPNQLNQRIAINDPIIELDLMVQQMNALLGRVEQAFDRERRFSGDVAHELRTPLTELRTLVEVRQRWPEDPALAKEFTADVGQATRRMQRTVESLLALSRSEGNATTVQPFDGLPEFVNQAVESLRERAATFDISLLVAIDAPSVIVQGRDEWPLIVCNLLDNAIDHSERGSTVFIALQVDKDRHELQLTVTNTVAELDEQDLPHLFERLWRKDASRTSALHSGLGLALVKACSERVGASINCQLVGKELSMLMRAPLIESVEQGQTNETDLAFQEAM
jgi:signal transduction histidine kinase